ncbi:MAG: class I mannose-6-phosphate isomerase [Chloroflexi bacterium]|nr:class I mannose-6-phosphate isomerase [Chloroflexota bacterium]
MRSENEFAYPLKFAPVAQEKIWGGERLKEMFGPAGISGHVISGRPVGEIWLVWDQLTISNGPWQGQRLADVVQQHPREILGESFFQAPNPVFPHLIKFLDAQETLSVQVHPGDAYAQAREGQSFGKAEMWYVIEARPGARIIHGVRQPVTREEMARAVAEGKLADYLQSVEVFAGDVIMNYPGTIHALGSGILIYELQQSSDLTYRLYDWDRQGAAGKPRELHIEKSLDVAQLQPHTRHKIEPICITEPAGKRMYLATCPYFAAELLVLRASITESTAGRYFHVLTVLGGSGRLKYGPSLATELQISRGTAVLIPASIHQYEIEPGDGELRVIKSYIPDMAVDIIAPLRKKGIPESWIAQLAG